MPVREIVLAILFATSSTTFTVENFNDLPDYVQEAWIDGFFAGYYTAALITAGSIYQESPQAARSYSMWMETIHTDIYSRDNWSLWFRSRPDSDTPLIDEFALFIQPYMGRRE